MLLQFRLPLSIYLIGDTEAGLALSTSFDFRNLTATVTIRPTEILRMPEGAEAGYFSQAEGIGIVLQEPSGVTFLSTLVGADTFEDLVALLTKIANRALLSIRNFGTVPHLREVRVEGRETDALLDRWKIEVSDDGNAWRSLRPNVDRGFLGLAALLATTEEPFRELRITSWPDIAEAMADGLEPQPEQEFFTNCVEHLRERSFRLALIEAIICLEIVLSQFLRVYFKIEKGMSKSRIERVLQPSFGLSGRIAGLLTLTAERHTLEMVDVDAVLAAVEWRNTIIHKTGRLPQGVDEATLRNHISAVLVLAVQLGRKRDELLAEPDLKRTAEELAQDLVAPAPTLRRVMGHVVWAEYFFKGGPPSEGDMIRIARATGERLRAGDVRFEMTEHLYVRFVGFPWHATWSWSKGQLRQTSAGGKLGEPALE
jgi:hypothetical protein